MDDAACREFFSQTTNPYHRRYEALRAVFVERRPQKEVAQQFGYQYGSLRQLVYEFRQHCLLADPLCMNDGHCMFPHLTTSRLCEPRVNNFATHVGQPEIAALEAVGQP